MTEPDATALLTRAHGLEPAEAEAVRWDVALAFDAIAVWHARRWSWAGDDAVQIARMGLFEGVSTWRPPGHLRRWLHRRTFARLQEDLAPAGGRRAHRVVRAVDAEIARGHSEAVALELTGHTLRSLRRAREVVEAGRPLSLDAPLGEDDDRTLADTVPADEPEPCWDADRVWTLLERLPDRLQRLLRLRYGLDGPPLRLREVGADLGISESRTYQLEGRALRLLRAALR